LIINNLNKFIFFFKYDIYIYMPKADTENQLLPETTNDNNNKCNICYAFGAIIVIAGFSLLINYDINYNRENDNSNSL